MSVKFNPKTPSTQNSQPTSQPKQKPSLFQRWAESVYEGYLMERMPSKKYCGRAWTMQTGKPASQATQVFMRSCIRDVEEYKAFCRWSRLN